MRDDPIDRLEAAAQQAEDAWKRGELVEAQRLYSAAVSERLDSLGYGVDPNAKLEEADFVVFERLSDLSRMLGRGETADQLLAMAIAELAGANVYWADWLRVKRVDLALGSGELRQAQALLDEMRPTIGDVREITFTREGLKEWEEGRHWSNTNPADRNTIFLLLSFVMGRLLAALGQYVQAEATLLNGLEHANHDLGPGRAYLGPRVQAKQTVVPLKLALANALLERGEFARATEYLTQLKGQADERKQPALFVQTLELEGKLNLSFGNLGAALAGFRQVLAFCAGRGFGRAALTATLNLSQILILVNQTLNARRHLLLARQQAQADGNQAAVAQADWLLQLASARAESLADGVAIAKSVTEQWRPGATVTEQWQPGAPDQESPEANQLTAPAAPVAGSAARAFSDGVNPLELPQSDNYLAFFEERALGFHWLLGRREFGACADYLAHLQKVFAFTDSHLIKLRLLVLSGLLAYYQLEFAQAEQLLMSAKAELQRLGLLPELWQTQRIIGWCWLKLGRDESLLEELATENAALLREMVGSLAQEDRAFFLLNKWTVEEEELALHISKLSRLKATLEAAPWHRRWRLGRQLRGKLDEFVRLVDRYRDMTARWAAAAPDTAQAVASGVPVQMLSIAAAAKPWRRWWHGKRRHATLSFLVLPDRVFVLRASRFSIDFGVSPATRIEVRELVAEWHELVADVKGIIEQDNNFAGRGLGAKPHEMPLADEELDDRMAALGARAREVADRLSEILQLTSILDNLPGTTRALTIVPDDSLHGFPFAAITHRGRYLVEQYALAFAYTSSERKTEQARIKQGALLVGASRPGDPWPELEFVPKELDTVETWATQRRLSVCRLDDATPDYPAPDKATMLAALPQATVVHLACHGQFIPDDPAQSGMILRSAPESEVLSVQELSALDLSNVEHVTLSACWSADHFVLPGRWVISLPETLARAGAGSVLGCLWVVNDRIGTTFMAQFYRNLNRYSRSEALRRTQLACLNGEFASAETTADTTNPIYWAGYHLYGSADALK